MLYVSSNEGKDFDHIPVSFQPHVISCNPLNDKNIVGHDLTANEVCKLCEICSNKYHVSSDISN